MHNFKNEEVFPEVWETIGKRGLWKQKNICWFWGVGSPISCDTCSSTRHSIEKVLLSI